MTPVPLRPIAAAALALFLGWSALSQPSPSAAQERGRGPAAGRGAAPTRGAEPQGRGERERERQDEPEPPKPPEPDMTIADRYFDVCDYNGDGWISFAEASEALGLDQQRYKGYDRYRDGKVTRDEFRAIYAETVRSLGSFRPPRPDPTLDLPPIEPEPGEAEVEPTTPPRSVTELFGQAVPRENEDEIIPRPPLIAGPVPVFRRLDLDADGRIAPGDLEDLLRPLHTSVRIQVVIASLDTDQDGTISPSELHASMRGRPLDGD